MRQRDKINANSTWARKYYEYQKSYTTALSKETTEGWNRKTEIKHLI